MRSTRLAALAVAGGAALLGWSTAGVTAIGGTLRAASPATTTPAPVEQPWQPPDRHHHDDVDLPLGHHDRRGGV